MRSKKMCALAIVFLAAGNALLVSAEPQTGDDVLKSLQGTWQFIAKDVDGKTQTKQEVAKLKITFAGNKWTVRDDGKVIQEGTHKFDPTKKPGQVDAAIAEGEGKGTTMLGIYEMTGDTFKVCFDLGGKQHPTSFTAKAGQMACVIQREKK